jgi:hypothetical protein
VEKLTNQADTPEKPYFKRGLNQNIARSIGVWPAAGNDGMPSKMTAAWAFSRGSKGRDFPGGWGQDERR